MGFKDVVEKIFINTNNALDAGKYGTLRSALGRRIKELDAQKIPLTVDNVSEKVLNSKMSMRALATRLIDAKEVREVAEGMIRAHNNANKPEYHLSFK